MATIGIDVTALSSASPGGIGTSLYRTMRALAQLATGHRFIMYAAKPPVTPFGGEPLDVDWELRLGSGLTTRSNIVWMQTGVNRLLAKDGVDIFWSPRHLLPFRAHCAKVATIQDFWHRYHPEQQPLANRIANRQLIARVVADADRIVTASRATAADVMRFHDTPAEKIDVVPLGVDPAEFAPAPRERVAAARIKFGLEKPYVLSLDVYNPRKNFSATLHGLALLPERLREQFDVVALGRPRKTASEIDPFAKAVALGVRKQMHFLGDVSPDELVALYSGATALVYPSIYEGFGMPILEAMACGCPVIAGDRSSLPEVAGTAALLVDPDAPTSLAAALTRIFTEPTLREALSKAGAVRAAGFTWEATARGMLASFERALASHAEKDRA